VVLAAVLDNRDAIGEAREFLEPDSFYSDANRRIFEAACRLDDEGRSIDAAAIAGTLRASGRLEQVGGTPYLIQLIGTTPAANLTEHCRTVAELARTRAIILAAQSIAAEGYGSTANDGYASRAEQVMFDATASRIQQWPAEPIRPIVSRVFEDMAKRTTDAEVVTGINLPWASMRHTFPGGMEFGKMHVIAARPGMGKSVWCSELCRSCSAPTCGALIASLEMTRDELAERMLAAESMVPGVTIRFGELSSDQWSSLTGAASALMRLPVSIWYRPGASLPLIRSTIRREAARMRNELGVELRIVVVDYMQLIRSTLRQSRETEISDVSRELTCLAGETGVALIAVSQLNREAEKRPNKRPQLSDLRESGSIEQDAYSVSFLYRDEYYERDKSEEPGVCEVITAKHRNGPTGVVKLRFRGEISRFDDLTQESQCSDEYNDLDRYP